MAISQLPNLTLPFIDTPQFNTFEKQESKNQAKQIAQHLGEQLICFGDVATSSIRVPSVLTLADFYQRPISEVLEALVWLRREHFEFVMQGLDKELILHDPLARACKKAGTHAHSVAAGKPPGFFYRWYPLSLCIEPPKPFEGL